MENTSSLIPYWIIFAVVLPVGLSTLIALPIWLKRRVLVGNLVGSLLVVVAIVVLIWQQLGVTLQAQATCGQPDANCRFDAQAIYAPYLYLVVIGWMDVFAIFIFSGIVEDRLKHRRLDRSQL